MGAKHLASMPGPVSNHKANDLPYQAILVLGSGNSGCKRILRILDFSPVTHCRNEVDLPHGSPLRKLREEISKYVLHDSDAIQLEQQWDNGVAWSSQRSGPTDIRPIPPKDHDNLFLRKTGLNRVLDSPKLHNMLRMLFRPSGDVEWLVRGRNSRIASSVPVLKINQVPAIARWLLAHRPQHKVIHVVRHPAGFLYSWERRVLAPRDPIQVRHDNICRLRKIVELNPVMAARFGDIESLTVDEAELYFWLYETESIYEAGLDNPQYQRILDEKLYTSPIDLVRQLYSSCGLRWGAGIEAMLRDKTGGWRERYSPWKDLVQPRQVEFIEGLLERSKIRAWWELNEYVSRCDYHIV